VSETIDELGRKLLKDRDFYARAMKMYESGQERFLTDNVDVTTYHMANLRGILLNMDELLKRMGHA